MKYIRRTIIIITDARKEETGNWEFDLQITNEEVEQLVNLSIQTLIREGIISLCEQDEQQVISLPTQNAPSTTSVN